jgi:hypothetical protein
MSSSRHSKNGRGVTVSKYKPPPPRIVVQGLPPECQFCYSNDWDKDTSTCRSCGTTMPANGNNAMAGVRYKGMGNRRAK